MYKVYVWNLYGYKYWSCQATLASKQLENGNYRGENQIRSGKSWKKYARHSLAIQDIVQRSFSYIRNYNPTSVIYIGGICNVTVLHRPTHTINLVYNTVDELADHVITAFEDSSKHALSEFLNIRIAFGGLIGMAGMSPQQAIVDEAIIRINAFIKDLNARNHVIHPRLTSKIHWWKKDDAIINTISCMTDYTLDPL